MLKVASIFRTVDGEVTFHSPWQWTTFVRLGGCNLRCWKSSGFCDAPHTLDMSYPYLQMTSEEICDKVETFKTGRVTLTGGEPLVQKEGVIEFVRELWRAGFTDVVTLETSGSISFDRDFCGLFSSVIVDVKPPSTEMHKKNDFSIHEILREEDYIKVVLADRNDYEWATKIFSGDDITTRAKIVFGVKFGWSLGLAELASWIERDERFDIGLNVQTHKYIWPECNTPPLENLKLVDHEKMLELER